MKVKELIQQLQQCDPEAVVCTEEMQTFIEDYKIDVRRYDQKFYYDIAMNLLQGDIVVIK